MRVLTVDDERTIRKVVRRIVERMGHTVDEAEDAPTALAKALTGEYDLILLDHSLPGGDGASICDAIHRSPNSAHTAVLMCTSMSGQAYEQRIARAGAIGLLSKPFSIDELGDWIDVVAASVEPPRLSVVAC